MTTICVIPARMASTRFPGKPLVDLAGMPMILHIWHRCRLARGLDRIVVATCDQAIFDTVTAAGGEAVMTLDTHPGCVDRTSEAVAKLDLGLKPDDLVLMVQGDEVTISPEMLEEVIRSFGAQKCDVANLATIISDPADHDNADCVKVCAAPDGRALFFSRSPIPSRARAKTFPPVYQQTGIIGFSAEFLEVFGRLPQTPLEMIEHIDMLRTLEHGYRIQIVVSERETVSVDTPADRDRAEGMVRADPVTARYLDRVK